MSSKDREKSDIFTVIAEILEVANNPNPNKNRGSTVRGDRPIRTPRDRILKKI